MKKVEWHNEALEDSKITGKLTTGESLSGT